MVGQTDIVLSDINNFRTKFNLPAINLKRTLAGSQSPGVVPGDVDEAALDIEWAGAVARNATIVFVYSNDVWQSAMYAVDKNLGTVMTMSYGACELYDLVDLPTFQQLAQQANAEGITWVSASGDSGATDCEDAGATIAQNGFAVDVPSSIPEITGMGGTEFNEGAGGGYWNSTNNANGASAVSYIPERVWNDTALGGGLAAGGGGASIFFPQPSWQTGPGVPNDGARHVPDLSFSASAEHDGYYVVSGGPAFFGGTSAAAPTMAGIVALLNQYLVGTGAQSQPGLGNINPTLYRLAQTNASEVFHDITVGDNGSPCASGTPNCVNGVVARTAGTAYDMASGLGSVNAYNLVHSWTTQAAAGSSVVISIDQNPVFESAAPDAKGNLWSYTLTLSEEAGIPTTITGLTIDGTNYTSQIATLFGSTTIGARQSVSASLGFGSTFTPHTVTFVVSGVDVGGRTWTVQQTIPFTAPRSVLTVGGVSNAASGQQVYVPGELVSVYGTGMGSMAQSAATIPLPQFLAGFEAWVNNVPTPIWYVSPNQVNLQIPYETAPGSTTLTVGNPWENVDYQITVSSAGPGIFTFPTGAPGGLHQSVPQRGSGADRYAFHHRRRRRQAERDYGQQSQPRNRARTPASRDRDSRRRAGFNHGAEWVRWNSDLVRGSDADQLHDSRHGIDGGSAGGGDGGDGGEPAGEDQYHAVRYSRPEPAGQACAGPAGQAGMPVSTRRI